MQLFMGSVGSRLESAASISLQLCLSNVYGSGSTVWRQLYTIDRAKVLLIKAKMKLT